jgi:hypothetical protein
VDIRINEVHSQIRATDSRSLLDPRILQEIVRACVMAVKEELARDKRIAAESKLTSVMQTDEQ